MTSNLLQLPYKPERSTYLYEKSSNVVSTELNGGMSRSRLDVIGGTSTVQASWFLKSEDYQFFVAFYNSVAGKGSRQFKIDLILDKPYIQTHIAKFVPDTFEQTDPRALSVRVQAQLEVTPIEDVAYDYAFVQYTLDPVGFDSLMDEIEVFVNTDLNIFGL